MKGHNQSLGRPRVSGFTGKSPKEEIFREFQRSYCLCTMIYLPEHCTVIIGRKQVRIEQELSESITGNNLTSHKGPGIIFACTDGTGNLASRKQLARLFRQSCLYIGNNQDQTKHNTCFAQQNLKQDSKGSNHVEIITIQNKAQEC